MTVPSLSIAFAVVSLVLSIGTPIILLIIFRSKYKIRVAPVLVGVAAFVVFALVLESALHRVVLNPDAAGNIALKSQPLLFVLYACFAAGIFEETARFLSFNLMKRKYNRIDTGLAYGVGHGGAESIILAGLSLISTVVLCLTINSGAIEATRSALSGDMLTALDMQIQTVVSTPSYMFLLSGIERLLAICIHISLSVIVFYSVARKDKRWLYPLAILLHAAVNVPAAMFQAGVIGNILVVEGLTAAGAALLALLAVSFHRRLRTPETNGTCIADRAET
jgi:uncharacterized membrane protein YhfC